MKKILFLLGILLCLNINTFSQQVKIVYTISFNYLSYDEKNKEYNFKIGINDLSYDVSETYRNVKTINNYYSIIGIKDDKEIRITLNVN